MTTCSKAEVQRGRATRRRGVDLARAIYAATLSELVETSFAELSFDKIATRAGTGKAAIYRRWASPAQLVLDALTDPVSGFEETTEPQTGTLRMDLLTLLSGFARALDEPRGQALRPLLAQRQRHPELYARVRELVIRPRHDLLMRMLTAAADGGEIRPEAVTARVAAIGPQLVIAAHMDNGSVSGKEVEGIVDEVLLPLLGA